MPITKEDAQAILRQVKANRAALDGCAGPHDFSKEEFRVGPLVTKWGCTKCGGTINTAGKVQYERGLAHGAGSGPLSRGNP